MKKPTEKETWEKIAQAFAKSETTGEVNCLTGLGLCAAVNIANDYPRLLCLPDTASSIARTHRQWLRNRMLDELKKHDLGEGCLSKCAGFWWPLQTQESFAERAMFAQLMAETCEGREE